MSHVLRAALVGVLLLLSGHVAAGRSHEQKSDLAKPSQDRPGVVLLDNGLAEADVEKRPYREYVRECAESLIRDGVDRYGPNHQPLLVGTLDVRTHAVPDVFPPEAAPWRVPANESGLERLRGCEPLADQTTIDVFYLLSKELDNPSYARFADAYLRCVTGLVCDKGLFWWGWHRHWDVDRDARATSKGNYHEVHIYRPRWEALWRVNPTATAAAIEAIWQWHVVNHKTGEHNRHANGKRGRSFPMSGGEFVYALAFRYSKTRDPEHLRQALRVADFHWQKRDRRTNLLPGQSSINLERFDGQHMDTSVTGIYCYFLLKSYELTGDETFRDQAIAYLKAYARYGYDPRSGRFYGSLRLDGTPEPGPRAAEGYEASEARGFVDLWEPVPLGYEAPIYTAQCYAYAYQLTKDPAMLDVARKWATWIRRCPPSGGCLVEDSPYGDYARRFSHYGTYADKYGRTISFFIHLYALTGEQGYLDNARRLAGEAVKRLYYNGLFRGHPAKAYYCSRDGVGFLLYALLQLDAVNRQPEKVVGAKAIPLGKGRGTMGFDNW
jgi:hypothetical protein